VVSRVVRSSALACLVVLAVSACGGGGARGAKESGSRQQTVVESAYGTGASKVWVFRPAQGDPRALVLFFHGLGDQAETTPYHHRPWLRHLAAEGALVFYPRYEQHPGAPGALRNAILGIRNAMRNASPDHRVPVVLIGYSRGAGLGFDYTAVAPVVGPTPASVLGVFPSMMDAPLDLGGIQPGTRFVFLVGEEDSTVGAIGATVLLNQLKAAKYPQNLISEELVRSHGSFTADHLSVLQTSPGAKAAFWKRADRLIGEVVSG
jgi:hypothetical protein